MTTVSSPAHPADTLRELRLLRSGAGTPTNRRSNEVVLRCGVGLAVIGVVGSEDALRAA
jgi:hypothetical protein